MSAGDLTALRALKDTTGRGLLEPNPTLPGASPIAGARVLVAPLPDGTAVIADARYIVVAVRRDASVDFSTDSAFTRDAVAARVTMRVDWAVADPSALYVIT